MCELFHRRTFVRSVIVAAMVELMLLGWSIYVLWLGGLEVGGRVFAALHVPSSVIFGIFFSWIFDISASLGIQALFVVVVLLSQLSLFASIIFWISEFLRRMYHKR